MSVSGRNAFPDVRSGQEALRDVREWSAGTRGWLGVVGRPSWMSVSGQESLPNVR